VDVRLEVRHLKLLAAVADEGSVTGAGRRLHLTQSALSHQLRDAEEKLGTPLFLRLGKKMILTPAGEKLLVCARRVLEELADAEEQIEKLNGGTRGVVRLSTECYTCYYWLPLVLRKFQKKFPRVEVAINVEATPHPLEALLEGKLDVAVISCAPASIRRNKNLRLTPAFDDEVVIVMPRGHRLEQSAFIKPADLAAETVLVYPPKEESTLVQKYLVPEGVEPKEVVEIPLTEVMIEMVAAGMGIAFLARWAISQAIASQRVSVRPLTQRGFRRQWYAATLRSQKAPFISDFVSLMADKCPGEIKSLSR
jgi:LysR family transcriptional regulator, regulator for metE and metH